MGKCTGYLAILLSISVGKAALGQSCDPQPFGTLNLSPAWNIDGAGNNIDSIDFWEHDADADSTLMFVTAKDNALVEVWRYPFEGNELTPLTHDSLGTANVNGVLVDQLTDTMYVSVGVTKNAVVAFDLPGFNYLYEFVKSDSTHLGNEPNLARANLTGGGNRIFLSSLDSVYVHDATDGTYLGEWMPTMGLETMAADSFYQAIYIPDENGRTGIYAYNFDGTAFTRNGTNIFGSTDFDADAEGILIVTCPLDRSSDDGSGFIVVADQIMGESEFEFFDRADWSHLGTLKLDGVGNTDGIASTQRVMTNYPNGLFVAVDGNDSVAGLGWDVIFTATAVLPIELSSFSVQLAGRTAMLTWQTESEADNAGFEVQHSRRTGQFEAIAFVPGAGTSTQRREYSHVVTDLESGRHWFRLRQIDLDGTSSTSPQVEVVVDLPGGFVLSAPYPNPFSELTTLELTVSEQQHVRVVLLDGLGREVSVLLETVMVPSDTRVLHVDGTGLAGGRYVVSATGERFTAMRQLVVVR